MNRQTVLVTGGAGYIGSHAVMALLESGYPVAIIDDLSTGNRDVVPKECNFYEGKVGDQALVSNIIQKNNVKAVMHFAGSIVVEESVTHPTKYYENNTAESCNLIEACVHENANHFLFSSTAAVYGNPTQIPVTETSELAPINPYGHSKAMVEQILKDVAHSSSLKYICLRYFNVAGADPEGRSGQMIDKATHLIKVACELADNKRDSMQIFGDDYDTPDGTCIRDFIHVSDLASAHVKALEYLMQNNKNMIMNCGYGKGYSVKEVLETLQEILGKKLNITQGPRRAGDPDQIVSDNQLMLSCLDWKPKYNDLKTILEHALAWERKL